MFAPLRHTANGCWCRAVWISLYARWLCWAQSQHMHRVPPVTQSACCIDINLYGLILELYIDGARCSNGKWNGPKLHQRVSRIRMVNTFRVSTALGVYTCKQCTQGVLRAAEPIAPKATTHVFRNVKRDCSQWWSTTHARKRCARKSNCLFFFFLQVFHQILDVPDMHSMWKGNVVWTKM